MKISVIIPVYNAEKFVKKAVQSVFQQNKIAEIVLVEDHSKDNSLLICRKIVKQYSNVKLIINQSNLGASASRNLGIINTKNPYIAFLDADDYYLPNFFFEAEKIFSKHPYIDGVFGTIGAHFYSFKAKYKHIERIGKETTGLNMNYVPNYGNLLDILIASGTGYFSIIGTIIKRSVLEDIGDFDEKLVQGEDTDFIWRLSNNKKLMGINYKKLVAIRGVHNNNRVFNKEQSDYYHFLLYKKWVKKIPKLNLAFNSMKIIIKRYLQFHPGISKYSKHATIRYLLKGQALISLFIMNPALSYKMIKTWIYQS